MTNVGVIGSGDVGQTLARGLARHGYAVRIASRAGGKLGRFTAETGIPEGRFPDVAAWADSLVLAVKGSVALEALAEIGDQALGGKLVIDTTNPIADVPPEDGVLRFFTSLDESLMERLQKAHPSAKFVKAFNTIGSGLMVDPALVGGRSTLFICGNDESAKADVARLVQQFGHDAWDMGTAKAARAIEPLCMLWCIPGFRTNDWRHAMAMLRG
jgi:predicted dinucleotide-binding enzyme